MFKELVISLCLTQVNAQFFNFFNQHQQQQPQQPKKSFQDEFLDNKCDKYLCPDTQACVASSKDCPCPFPHSQLKCVLPNNRFVCISKPSSNDQSINAAYDDEKKGSKVEFEGYRDCGWVRKAYEGLA